MKIGNRIARRVCYLLEYHQRKGHYYIIEQPLSSLLWRHKGIQKRLKKHNAKRVVVHLGNYGSPTAKPVACRVNIQYMVIYVFMGHVCVFGFLVEDFGEGFGAS